MKKKVSAASVDKQNGQKQQCRNLHACATIMRKGGVHEKSSKAKRLGSKQQLKKAMREGGNSSPFYCLFAA